MKSLINAVAVVVALTAPIVSFAQSSTQLTRAQVRAELVQLEKSGYHVGDGDQSSYPNQIQAAIARVSMPATGFGGVSSGSVETGTRSDATIGLRSIYAGR